MAPKESSPPAITGETRIPLSLAYGVLSVAVVGTGLAYGIYYRLGTLTDTVRSINVNGWTVQDQTLWSAQLANKNRALDVPEPRKLMPADAAAAAGK